MILSYLVFTQFQCEGLPYAVEGLACFASRMVDQNEGGRLRWAIPLDQRHTCTRVFVTPIGRHMLYPREGKCCVEYCEHKQQMWFADDISLFLNQTSTGLYQSLGYN